MDHTSQFSWQIAHLRAGIAAGDLLHAPVEAIVNSEQTDFVLARNPATLSGAIREAWGASVQRELDEQTHRKLLPVGSVLATGGGPGGTILHLGLHAPDALDDRRAPDTAAYLPVVRRGVRDVLSLAAARGVRSVAFPLLGCGLFRLDPALVAYEMFGEFAAFAEESDPTRPVDVRVMVRDAAQVGPVVAAGVQAWIDRSPVGSARRPLELGVPWVDLYEAHHVASNRHPQWSAWTLARLAELVVAYVTASLATASACGPDACLPAGRPAAFGTLREIALKRAKASQMTRTSSWVAFLRERLLAGESGGHLRRLNEDRNNLAHGRAHRGYDAMRADLEAMIDIEGWRSRVAGGAARAAELGAWAVEHPAAPSKADFARPGARVGIAEAWGPAGVDYVVPWAGLRFRLRPPEAATAG